MLFLISVIVKKLHPATYVCHVELTSRSRKLCWTINGLSCKYGTQLGRSAFAPSLAVRIQSAPSCPQVLPARKLTCMSSNVAYYRGAMGILLVYDVTDDASFNNIRNWMRNIEQHASDNVNKVSPA